MATIFVGALLVVGLGFALRHVYRNLRDGKNDCCSTGCNGGCSGCSSHSAPK